MPALMASELPELVRTRHHWVAMFRLPSRPWLLAAVGLVVWGVFTHGIWVVLVLLAAAGLWLRWRAWRTELIILTTRRVIRVRGLPETTTSEASLRVDRISGTRLVQTVPGKLLGYATVELEAPGNHPDVHLMLTIPDPVRFYLVLRDLVYRATGGGGDPDEGGPPGPPAGPMPPTPPLPPYRPTAGPVAVDVTAPLPAVGPRPQADPRRPPPEPRRR